LTSARAKSHYRQQAVEIVHSTDKRDAALADLALAKNAAPSPNNTATANNLGRFIHQSRLKVKQNFDKQLHTFIAAFSQTVKISAGVKLGYSRKSLDGNFHTHLATLPQLEW